MKPSRRGIVLVSILILTLLATFFIGALVQLNPSRLRRTVHDENRDRASAAAKAGVDYALNRLKADIDWDATANDETVVMDDLVIREDRGNVLGWIRTENGAWTGFRMRFNYQNGAPTGDPEDDDLLDPNYPISSELISVNNLAGSNEIENKLGDGSNYSRGTTNSGLTVPPETVALLVEGISAPDLDPSDPEGLAQSQSVTTRTIEGIYKIVKIHTGLDGDSVWSGGGVAEFLFENAASPGISKPGLTLSSDNDNVARIRVKGEMDLTRLDGTEDSNLFHPDENAEVLAGTTFTIGSFTGGDELPEDPFLRIEYAKVQDSEQATPIPIPGGVYVFKRGNLDSGRTKSTDVEFYNMTWDQYRTAKINGPEPTPDTVTDIKEFTDRVVLDAKTVTRPDGSTEQRDVITFERDVDIVGLQDLTIIPVRGAKQKAGEDPVAGGGGNFLALPDIPATEYHNGGSQIMTSFASTLFGGSNANMSFDPNGDGTTSAIIFMPSLAPSYNFTQAQASTVLQTIYNPSAKILVTPAQADSMTLSGVTGFVENPDFTISITNPEAFIQSLTGQPAQPPFIDGGGGGGGGGTADPLHIPGDYDDPTTDKTVPQDIEIVFDPKGTDTAFIRSDGDIFLGTHLSGKGGGVISGGKLDIIGIGVDLQSNANNSEKDGIAIYGLKEINISTYDERINEYHDVDLFGAVYTEGDISLRLGEKDLPDPNITRNGLQPPWGDFSYEGAVIALGESGYYESGHFEGVLPDTTQPGPSVGLSSAKGKTSVKARSVKLFYDPRYLAPFLETGVISPTFAPLSVIER